MGSNRGKWAEIEAARIASLAEISKWYLEEKQKLGAERDRRVLEANRKAAKEKANV